MPAQVELQEEDDERRRRFLWWWWALPVAVVLLLALLVDGLYDGSRPAGRPYTGGSGDVAQSPAKSPSTSTTTATPAETQPPASTFGSGTLSAGSSGSGASTVSGGSGNATVGRPAPAATPSPAQPPPKQLTVVAGSVQGLVLTDAATAPTTTIPLTVTNPNNQVVMVTVITPRVTAVRRADGTPATGCPLSTLRITPFSGTLQIARSASSLVPLPVQLVNDPVVNQDACKQAVFSVVYDLGARSLT